MALDVSGTNSLYWKTGINNAGLLAGSTQAKGILRGLAGAITKMDVFAGLAIGSALVFAKMSKQAYNFSKEFETAMKEVQTISKATQDNFKGISQEIIDMSKTVPDSAQKLTKALYQIVSAGYDGAKAMDILKTSAELAVATVTDTFTAADALTYVMNAYGESAGTAAEISDKLFTIVKLGKVKMEELGPTLSMVTGLAAEAGMSFNDLGAFYAEAVKKIQPHIVSTGIRGFVTALLRASKEGAEAAKAAKEMGIEFDIATLKSKGLEYMLKQMSEATEGQKEKLMELFPNVRGLIGLLAIMTNEGMNFKETSDAITNSLGNNTKAFKTMMDTTENQLAILHNNVMAKLKPLGDEILKSMNGIAKGINIAMSGATDSLSNMSRAYSELADTLRRKQSRIDELTAKIEDLRSKLKEGKDVSIELKSAEDALITLLPNLGKAAREAGADFDILTAAKEETAEATLRIMKTELTLAEIEEKQAAIALTRFERSEDEANKEVKRLKEKVATWYEEISNRQTAPIKELFRTMSMYYGDDYTKQIKALIEVYDGAGISVMNFGGRIRDIQEDMKLGEDTTERQIKLIKEVTDALFAKDTNLEETMLDLATAELKVGKTEIQLRLDVEKTTEEVNIQTEAVKKLEEILSKPPTKYYPESKYGPEPITKEPKIITTLTDEQVKDIEAKLKYMASQYKRYNNDLTVMTEEELKKRYKLLHEEGSNYGEWLNGQKELYKDNAELIKIIDDDIYEYNKGILIKRKQDEKEVFDFIATNREKDLAAQKESFDKVISILDEGTADYLKAQELNKQEETEINLKYDKEIAEAKLAIFKEGWEKQIGEEKEAYVKRLEAKLKELEAEKVIDVERVEFIRNKLQEIIKIEKAAAKEKRELLDSYFAAYQTTEEKIISIHKKTAELLLLTDDEYEKERLKNIEEMLIAEIEASEATKEVNEKLAAFGEDLNNKELENKIKTLEAMKLEYANYRNEIIKIDEAIAESQKQIWENVRSEIDDTVNALHNLADAVGNFDSELKEAINDMADLVSGIGQIASGFSMGGIGGIATALGGIATIISSIINLFVQHKTDVPELEEELKKITLELQAQQYILNQATGIAETAAIKERIALLQEQIDVYYDLIAAEEAAYGQFLWWTWDETNQEAIDNWLSSIESVNAEIFNLNQQYQQILTGTTAETIADAIAEGFSQGLDSAQVFADTFNDMMKKAIVDAFKRTIITKYIEDWYNLFSILSGGGFAGLLGLGTPDGGLTAQDIEFLSTTFQNMLEDIETEWGAFADILEAAGLGLEEAVGAIPSVTGLTGAIAGITEETAGLLAGQFQAIRINTVSILSNMENIIIINSRIADNTEYNKYLENIWNKMNTGVSLENETLRGIGGS